MFGRQINVDEWRDVYGIGGPVIVLVKSTKSLVD